MSHIFLFGGVKIGSNTAFNCFVLQSKLIYSIKYVVYKAKTLSLIKRTLAIAHCHRTGKMIFLLPQRGSKDCIQTTYGEKSSSEPEGVHNMSWWL